MPSKPVVQVEKIKATQAISIALLSGLFGLAGSWVQLQIVKPATLTAVRATVNETVPMEVDRVVDQEIPIGTVITSFLEPKAFAKVAGDDGSLNPQTSKWLPADGRDAPGSAWAKTHGTKIPDLRGVFLRGLNYTEPDRMLSADSPQSDPDTGRTPGSFQADSLASHFHPVVGYDDADTGAGGDVSTLNGNGRPRADSRTEYAGGKETRPKNIAVYYYIKVNEGARRGAANPYEAPGDQGVNGPQGGLS